MHMSPILLGHATLNCVVWHLFVDSWQVMQLPHLYLLLLSHELTTVTQCCLVLLMILPPLQRIQNNAARVILRLPKSSSITTHLKLLNWLPVKVRSTYEVACLCCHCHSSTAPLYIACTSGRCNRQSEFTLLHFTIFQ